MNSIWASQKFRRAAIQIAFVAIVAIIIVASVLVGRHNIMSQGMATGFGFLEQTTGWTLGFSVFEVGPRSTYTEILLAGLLNTVVVGLLTLVFASLLGLIIALMRVSNNTLMKIVGGAYVEIFRNVPIILQVVFWYAILTHMPGPREAYEFGSAIISNRGIMLPVPAFSVIDLMLLFVGLVAMIFWIARSSGALRSKLIAVGAFVAFFVVLLLTGRAPDTSLISVPELQGLRFKGGLTLKPEFTALLVGLVLFGASYIGEIIRGGLISVERGKLEAAAALGMTNLQINRLIRIPLALRAMLPALANQYVWLMKGTTVGIVVGFPDYFAVISTSINQSGQTLELLGLLMLGFFVVNYTIATLMNLLNKRLKIKGRT